MTTLADVIADQAAQHALRDFADTLTDILGEEASGG
jgi:hypothetical protein